MFYKKLVLKVYTVVRTTMLLALRVVSFLILSFVLVGAVLLGSYFTYKLDVWKPIVISFGYLSFLLPLIATYIYFFVEHPQRESPCTTIAPFYLLGYIVIVVVVVGACQAPHGKGVHFDLHDLYTQVFLVEAALMSGFSTFLWFFPCVFYNSVITV